MKTKLYFYLIAITLSLTSCNSVRTAADYDRNVNFNNYKTFAFFKTGIDKAEISDLDKKRILRAIESELMAKGYTKSESPDLLVSIFTKSQERVNVYNTSVGWGWGGFGPGWGWGLGWNQPMVSTHTEGTLYIDLIDAEKKDLIWQGMGTGNINTKDINKKEEQIKEFVNKILATYPPESK